MYWLRIWQLQNIREKSHVHQKYYLFTLQIMLKTNDKSKYAMWWFNFNTEHNAFRPFPEIYHLIQQSLLYMIWSKNQSGKDMTGFKILTEGTQCILWWKNIYMSYHLLILTSDIQQILCNHSIWNPSGYLFFAHLIHKRVKYLQRYPESRSFVTKRVLICTWHKPGYLGKWQKEYWFGYLYFQSVFNDVIISVTL